MASLTLPDGIITTNPAYHELVRGKNTESFWRGHRRVVRYQLISLACLLILAAIVGGSTFRNLRLTSAGISDAGLITSLTARRDPIQTYYVVAYNYYSPTDRVTTRQERISRSTFDTLAGEPTVSIRVVPGERPMIGVEADLQRKLNANWIMLFALAVVGIPVWMMFSFDWTLGLDARRDVNALRRAFDRGSVVVGQIVRYVPPGTEDGSQGYLRYTFVSPLTGERLLDDEFVDPGDFSAEPAPGRFVAVLFESNSSYTLL